MTGRFLETNRFLEWMSSGTAAASLALFIYVIEASEVRITVAILFLVAMASSISATAIAKEIGSHNKITKKANILHAITLTTGCFAFLGGLGCLALAVSLWLFISLAGAFILAWLAYLAAFNSLAK